jgi:phage tail-like protein
MVDDARPFTAFNFSVEIYPDGKSAPLAKASFAECDGLEMTHDLKTIRSGGANDRAIRVPGAVNYSNLTLKRGMTDNLDLWTWFEDSIADPYLRANAEIVLLGGNGTSEVARFQLHRCLPAKIKAPALNAKDGQVAIEEFQLAYEKLQLARPSGGGGA